MSLASAQVCREIRVSGTEVGPRGAKRLGLLTGEARLMPTCDHECDGILLAKTRYPMWQAAVVEAVSNVLASTDWPGLTGTEIGRYLGMLGIPDVNPSANKRTRLWYALMMKQQADQASNCVIRLISEVMAPGHFISDNARFTALQDGLGEALSLVGLRVDDRGRVAKAQLATTLDEVGKLAGRLRAELTRRGVHLEVSRYCEEELLRKSIFHAVFEATKGLAERLRQLSGSTLDGADLVDYCFGAKTPPPVIRINAFRTETDRSEHTGFANLLRGMFGTFRNPPAHTPRVVGGWTVPRSHADLEPRAALVALVRGALAAPANTTEAALRAGPAHCRGAA